MTTALATIADALIEFILSLLRDPAAAAQFATEPEEMLSDAGLSGLCAADVRAVVPVVVDRPDVVQRPVVSQSAPMAPNYPGPQQSAPAYHPAPSVQQSSNTVVEEITNVTNNFAIDARSTIIDQSVNQNIWANGDVTQIFDQEANVASGDGSIAAGQNVVIDESETTITTGDVAIGNTDITNEISDSFNDASTTTQVDVVVNPVDQLPPPDALGDAAAVSDDVLSAVAPLPDDASAPIADVLAPADPDAGSLATEYEDTGTVLYDPAGYDIDGLGDQ